MNRKYTSVHSAGIEQIHEMPLNEIIRPIPPQVDEKKIKSLMAALSVSVLHYIIYIVLHFSYFKKAELNRNVYI